MITKITNSRITGPVFWSCLLFVIGLSNTLAQDCSFLAPYKNLTMISPQTIKERVEQAQSIYDLKLNLSSRLYSRYISGDKKASQDLLCIQNLSDKSDWEAAISKVFFEQSIARLSQSNIKQLNQLMSALATTQLSQGMALFKAAPHFPGDEGEKKAGVYRGSKSMFMNIALIPSTEWNYILVHELFHYIDPDLKTASEIWNKKVTAQKIFELAKTNSTISTLSKSDSQMLKSFILSGLDRGLLAEYRAWLLCFSIYEQGKMTGLWGTIPWMENILQEKYPNESWEGFTFRYLDRNFEDPDFTGIFSLKIMQEQYFQLRQELRRKFK